MTSERICIIHIGTHKTATTSQQYFLMQNAASLLEKGLFFPSAGWYGVVPGHHRLAWELHRESDGPILAEVLGQIEASGAPAAILSAEDFSTLHVRPDRLEALANALAGIGYSPRILVYLRAQASYAESMYVEQLKHNNAKNIAEYVREALETGRHEIAQHMLIEFRYSRLLATFARVFGKENLLARPYNGISNISLAFSDYLESLARLGDVEVDRVATYDVNQPVANESMSFIRLLGTLFITLCPGVDVPATAAEFASLYAPDLPREFFDQRFALFQRMEYQSILRSVVEDNRLIEAEYGVRVPFQNDADVPSAIDSMWAKALVERRIFDRCYAQWSTGTDG